MTYLYCVICDALTPHVRMHGEPICKFYEAHTPCDPVPE